MSHLSEILPVQEIAFLASTIDNTKEGVINYDAVAADPGFRDGDIAEFLWENEKSRMKLWEREEKAAAATEAEQEAGEEGEGGEEGAEGAEEEGEEGGGEDEEGHLGGWGRVRRWWRALKGAVRGRKA